jgi:hypothetical protein
MAARDAVPDHRRVFTAVMDYMDHCDGEHLPRDPVAV